MSNPTFILTHIHWTGTELVKSPWPNPMTIEDADTVVRKASGEGIHPGIRDALLRGNGSATVEFGHDPSKGIEIRPVALKS